MMQSYLCTVYMCRRGLNGDYEFFCFQFKTYEKA